MNKHVVRLIVAAILLLAGSDFAQQATSKVEADTALARRHFYHAINLTKKVQYDSANFYLMQSRGIYEKFAAQSDDSLAWASYVVCSNMMGDNLRKKGDYKNALAILQEGLHLGKQRLGERHAYVADAYNNLGNVAATRADFDQAIEYFSQSLTVARNRFGENHTFVARAYNNLGNVIGDKGDLEKASEYYARALRLRLKLYGEKHSLVATTYLNLATVDHLKGDYDKALAGFDQAQAIWSRTLGEEHPQVALCCLNRGIVQYDQGQYQQALASHTKALELFQKAHGDSSLDVGDCYGNIANVYAALGKHEEALALYQKSLAVLHLAVEEDHPLVAMRYNNIGDTHFRRGEYDQAIAYFEKDLDLQQKIYGKHHWDLSEAYQELGKCHLAKNNPRRALQYYQQSLLAIVPDFVESDVYRNPTLGKSLTDAKLLTGLAGKAEALAQLYAQDERELRALNMSLATSRLAAELIDKIRGSYQAEGSKLFLGKAAGRIYGEAIRHSLRAFVETKLENHRRRAFTFAEQGKASVLAEALQESRARQFSGIPARVLEEERELRLDLAFYETEIQKEKVKTAERDEERLRESEGRYWKHKQEYEKLIKRLEKSYPAYYNLKYRTEVATVAEIQKALDEHTALVEYFATEKEFFVFVLTNAGFTIHTITKDSALTSTLATFASAVKSISDQATFRRSASRLYNALIMPVAAQLANRSRWVIIPDGELYQVPFEALLTASVESGAKVENHALPYLIKQREISYHYSATLFLKSQRERAAASHANLFAGFAPVFSAANGRVPQYNLPGFTPAKSDATFFGIIRDGSFEPLLASATEVQSIAAFFSERSRVFLHEQATEENFKNNVTGSKYVHVATHGVINNETPKLSLLAFSQPQQADSLQDGILFSSEIYNLALNADLVVLSACQTGAGQILKGEGLMALTRGFFYSGARNIIASLWNVYDDRTSRLMVEMYREIAADKSYSAALRAAKLKMIADPATATPQSWAGFVLIGR